MATGFESLLLPVLLAASAIVHSSCAYLDKKSEYDANPICIQMKKACGEYEKALAVNKRDNETYLNTLKENCNSYTYSCGKIVQGAGE